MDDIFKTLSCPKEMRAIRNLAETKRRRDMEVITYQEMSLATGAINKMVCNLTSVTKKRDPPTFRSQLPTIRRLIIRELDRLRVSPSTLTKTEDIKSTLALVKEQLTELKRSNSINKPDLMASAQKGSLRKIHRSIKKRMRSIKRRIRRGQRKLQSSSEPKSDSKDQNTN